MWPSEEVGVQGLDQGFLESLFYSRILIKSLRISSSTLTLGFAEIVMVFKLVKNEALSASRKGHKSFLETFRFIC